MAPDVCEWCTKAERGCTECKVILSEQILKYLQPIRERRRELEKNPDTVWDILAEGKTRAIWIATETMQEVRKAVFKA